jgi:hypothetical protein
MQGSVVLPVMGVLTVIAGAVGLQLGESAIAQIDPVHFQGAPPELRDVTANPRPRPVNAYAGAYGWEAGQQVRAADCGDCPALNARDAYAVAGPLPDPSIARDWEEQPAYDAAAPDPEAQRYATEWRRVSRYVHYPVTPEQAEIAESLAVDSPRRLAPLADEPSGL